MILKYFNFLVLIQWTIYNIKNITKNFENILQFNKFIVFYLKYTVKKAAQSILSMLLVQSVEFQNYSFDFYET